MSILQRISWLFSFALMGGMYLLPGRADAQCFGIPSITALGSNKIPVGLCAPVQANVTYSVTFTAPVPAGTLELVYDWGDGSTPAVLPLTTGSKTYNASQTHTFPLESDCEYVVTITMRYNGQMCTSTNQIQKISSWRTDQFNGGNVALVTETTGNNVHLVCEGENINVVFDDATNWNCNTPAENVEAPNTEYRWQQIVYNVPAAAAKIPDVKVENVPITGTKGTDIVQEYQDPRGVLYMSAPVMINDARRRSSLRITAPGGFGADLPKAGDEFGITLRYWNFCNPYDDPEIPGPPSDLINGDHPPVEKTSWIRIVTPPKQLAATNESVCHGTTPSNFSVTGVGSDNIVKWYEYVPGSTEPGRLISSGKSTLAITAHPQWKNNTTPSVLRVWATQQTKGSDTNCESQPILISRTILDEIKVPDDLAMKVPGVICNGQSFTISLPERSSGDPTIYTWKGSAGLTFISSTATTATFMANVADFGTALYSDRTLTITRRYESAPACGKDKVLTVRINAAPKGGEISGKDQLCETDAVGSLKLTGHVGSIIRWEVSNGGAFVDYRGALTDDGIAPGFLKPGTYRYRAVVKNGSCDEVYSHEKSITVSQTPSAAYAGNDQFICSSLRSAALNASNPSPGIGKWTYVASVPAGLPTPSFESANPNTTVMITAEHAGVYTMRWTVTNGACSTADDVIIDFGTDPTDPDAGKNRSVCGPTTNLEGNVPVKGLGRWSFVRGPEGNEGSSCVVIADDASPVTAVELSGSTPRYGQYTFRWSISSGGNNCFLKSDDVTINFEEPVKVTAPDIAGLCLDADELKPVELSGQVTGPFREATWVNVTGTGSVTTSSEKISNGVTSIISSYQFSKLDYENGQPVQVKLVVTPASQSCQPQEQMISLRFNKKPIVSAGSDIDNHCSPEAMLHATSSLPVNGYWSADQPRVTFDDVNDPQTTVKNLPMGTTTLTWTVANEGSACSPVSSSVSITRVAPPPVTDFTATECAMDDNTTAVVLTSYENEITSLLPSDRSITWSVNEATLTNKIEGPLTSQEGVTDGQVYLARVVDTHTGCSSDAKLTIQVRSLPVVKNSVMTECETFPGSMVASGIDLNSSHFREAITVESNATVTWHHTAADAASNRDPIAVPVTVNRHQQFFARVTYTSSPYCYAVAKLDLMVNAQPAIGAIMGRESVCQGHSKVAGNLPVEIYQIMPVQGAKYHWQIPPDSKFQVFAGGKENDFYIVLQFPEVYTGTIAVSAELNGCSSAVVEKQITVSAAPSQPQIIGPAIVCSNESNVAFTVSPNNHPSSTYNWDIRTWSTNSSGTASIREGQLTGNILADFGGEDVIITVRESNTSCVSPSTSKVVKVASLPQVTLAVDQAVTEFNGNDGVLRTQVSGGTIPYVSYTLLNAGITDPDNDGVFTGMSPGSYSVKVVDAVGCVSTSNVQNLEHPYPTVKASFTASPYASCFPVTIAVQNQSIGADTFLWKLYRSGKLVTTSNLSSPSFSVAEPGNYDLHLVAGISGTDQSDEASLKGIQVFDVPRAAFELRSEAVYAPDTPVTLMNFSTGANYYEWKFGDGQSSNEFEPAYHYAAAGRYMLTLSVGYDYGMVDTDGDGTADKVMTCYDSARREVVALSGGDMKIPNAFTPDTDGPNGGRIENGTFNDVFLPLGHGITEFEMYIFDRWGSLVFESHDEQIGWEGYDRQGKLMPAGAYVYKIIVRLSNGEKITRFGDVTLIL